MTQRVHGFGGHQAKLHVPDGAFQTYHGLQFNQSNGTTPSNPQPLGMAMRPPSGNDAATVPLDRMLAVSDMELLRIGVVLSGAGAAAITIAIDVIDETPGVGTITSTMSEAVAPNVMRIYTPGATTIPPGPIVIVAGHTIGLELTGLSALGAGVASFRVDVTAVWRAET